MDKYYTLNELAIMTGLTTRTLRTYLKMNVLCGEKIEGTWRFTEEDISAFLKSPTVKPSIEAKQNGIVYDALASKADKENEACVILNLNMSDEEALEVIQYFNEKLNGDVGGNVRFHYTKNDTHVRIIISGNEDIVADIMKGYYCL